MAAGSVPAAGPEAQAVLGFNLTQTVLLKTCAALVLGIAGMYCLFSGREDRSLEKMLLGAALIGLGLLVF